eukprot:scaffold4153_cov91-Cylindrotheca_fusiformis.AAC.2
MPSLKRKTPNSVRAVEMGQTVSGKSIIWKRQPPGNRQLLMMVLLVLSIVSPPLGLAFHIPRRTSVSHTSTRAPPATSRPIQELILPRMPGGGTSLRASLLEGLGMPSNPGWGSGRLSRLTDWAESKTANRPIVCEYEPAGFWLWTKWRGTVLKMTLRSCLILMSVAGVLDWSARRYIQASSSATWNLFSVPPATEPLIQSLYGVKKLWEYQLTVTTFILTFFLSHAYGYWQRVYSTTRQIQGRINDFCMLLVMGAKRSYTPTTNGLFDNNHNHNNVNGAAGSNNHDHENLKSSDRGEYTAESEKLVRLCTRLIRLSHTFFWAATPTASNGLTDSEEFLRDAENCPVPITDQHIGPLLLSTYGLKALVRNKQLTKEEAEDLMNTELPPTQYAYILLVWVGLYCMEGLEKGILRGGNGFEENLLRQLTTLRATMFDIDDMRAGRMPLAYVQLVQVMVDTLMALSPFALYPELGSLSIPLVGVEGFAEQNIRVDVLVSELNFGAAKRWIQAAGRNNGSRRLQLHAAAVLLRFRKSRRHEEEDPEL